MDQSMLIITLASFSGAALLTYGLFIYTSNRREFQDRFAKTAAAKPTLIRPDGHGPGIKDRALAAISSLGRITLGKDKEKPKLSDLRVTLIQAGFRYSNAVGVFFGIKAIFTIMLPLCYFLYITFTHKITTGNVAIAMGSAALGYYLPNYLLQKALKQRQNRVDRALPDVLDLMIVSMEAGLSLQSTLNHVADEVKRISKDFHAELRITNAELRTGIPRDMALKNMGDRTGVQSVKSLIALMIQSEKMGASISQSLRTHADFVRVQRGQRAEEMAAKLPIKILFPTLFCIFPAIFIVILGPAAIQIYHTLLKK
jgi:tight adherence protein C